MGQRWRHFKALMRKNFIVTKRTKCASCCEVLCPVVLMIVLALARFAISIEDVEEQSWIKSTKMYHPLPEVNFTETSQALYANPNDTQRILSGLLGGEDLLGFYNFSEASISQSPGLTLFPKSCVGGRDSDPRPLIAYAPINDSLGEAARYEVEKIYQQLLFFTETAAQLPADTFSSKNNDEDEDDDIDASTIIEAVSQLPDFQFKGFESGDDIVAYIADENYQIVDDMPGVCFGFEVVKNSNDEYSMRLFFHDQEIQEEEQSIPYQNFDPYSNISTSQDTDAFDMYTYYGFAHLHNIMANVILRNVTGNPDAMLAISIVPFKTSAYEDDNFALVISTMLPFFMLLIYILPISRMLQRIVSEKETKIRESMRMMGLVDTSYWLSWFVYYLIQVTIISLLCLIVLSVNVITYSNKLVIFLYLWLFGLAQFGFIIFIQCFFSSQRFAQIGGTLLYFGTSFVVNAVQDANTDQSAKMWASLLSTVAVSLGANNLGAYEEAGIGIQFDNIKDTYQNYTFSGALVMMVISFFLFLLLGIYMDNVLPSAFGRKKAWYFCLSPRYWCGKRRSNRAVKEQYDNEAAGGNEFELKYLKPANYEAPPNESRNLEKEKKMLKISGLKKTFDNGFQAVKGVNVKMYSGQIFALLGHNGAGKTTTISMLTGLIQNTSGTAEVFGYDIFEEMGEVRKFMGVCPQHDVLFEMLTPMEHLSIFCEFKGIDPRTQVEDCKKIIKDADLEGSENKLSKTLSGGNKRKLSVAIALVGGSKLVLLDEPTSGMDLSARRKLWNMLKNQKQDRIVILTTHYMDEADILGDRIGIMADGGLICLGSSLFLKNRFGVGYNLKMVKTQKENNQRIRDHMCSKLGEEVTVISEVSSEITFRVPNKYADKFPTFFEEFDRIQEQLAIKGYGISITTLEEVFLKVGHGEGLEDDDEKNKEHNIEEEAKNVKNEEDYSYCVSEDHEVGCFNVFLINLVALFRKRFFMYKRSTRTLIMEVFIPIVLVIIGLGFSKISFVFESPPRELVITDFPLKQRMLSPNDTIVQTSSDVSPQYLLSQLSEYEKAYDVEFRDYSGVNVTQGMNQILRQYDTDLYDMAQKDPLEPFRYLSFLVYQAENLTDHYFVSTFINLTSQDITAYAPAQIYEAVLRSATGNPNFKFKQVSQAHPLTQDLLNRQAAGNGMFVSFVVAIGFALIPTSIVGFIISEKEKHLKHMQLISGMNLSAYWISFYIFDILKTEVTMLISIALFYAFSFDYDYVWVQFLLFPVGVLPFTYASSFLFQSEGIGQTVTIFLHFVIAGIGSMVIYILRIIDSTFTVGDALLYVFKLVPSFSLCNTIVNSSGKGTLLMVRDNVSADDFAFENQGSDCLFICMHFVVWSLFLLFIESISCRSLSDYTCKRSAVPQPIADLDLDEDVEAEEKRVEQDSSGQLKIKVDKFRKVYTTLNGKPFLAVERSSFGVDQGECFALIGVNGAGKTTTFKTLTNDIYPTRGSIKIHDMEVNEHFQQVRKLIGYCPQYDTIFDTMTVWEHLDYYSRIKGIRKHLRSKLIDDKIDELNLTMYRDKPSGTLSGGNKRKLSVAMALLGNPPIILLDEPSAGMDPQARRFMWTVIAKVSKVQKKSSVVLTSHSMEEVEALADRLGIFVKGGIFRCMGSAQHIKEKFGTGYEIEIKFKRLHDENLEGLIRQYSVPINSGSNHAPLDQTITLNGIAENMRQNQLNEFLVSELRAKGLGNDLFREAEQNNGNVQIRNYLTWLYVELCGQKAIQALMADFQQVELLEHYNDYFKLKIEKRGKSIGYVFGFIEEKKNQLSVSEYSVSQTTLEQIFQRFANVDVDSIKGMIFEIQQDGKIHINRQSTVFKRNSSLRRGYESKPSKEDGPL